MMSFKDISLEEEKGVDVGRVERDGVGREGGEEKGVHLTTFYSSDVYGTHVSKGVDVGGRPVKWRKILVIVEGKMSLSRDAES